MIESIPHLPLGNFPTPVERLSNLERVLGFESLWIKRDDLSGPFGGGNKVRKLEYMFAAAQAFPDGDKKKTLFTIGPTGSNHVRATAVYGKASGFNVECLLFKQPPTELSTVGGFCLGISVGLVPAHLRKISRQYDRINPTPSTRKLPNAGGASFKP